MPRIAYTAAQKAEAVALAHVMGYEAAAKQLGIDPRSVLGWMRKAGKAPTLGTPPAGWQQLMELAQAKVATALSTGKISPTQAATIAGIAQRNLDRPKATETESKSEADREVDRLEAELEAHGLDVDLAVVALLYRYEAFVAQDDLGPAPTVEQDLAYVLSLGDLREWWERHAQERHEANERRLEANRAKAAAYQQRVLDDETQALIAAAEAFLSESAA